MRNIFKKTVAVTVGVLLVCCVCLFAVGCKKNPPPAETAEIVLDKSAVTLDVYERTAVTATVSDGKTAVFTVDDGAVAAIAQDGNACTVTALKAGSAVLKATVDGVERTCSIRVEDNGELPYFSLDNLSDSDTADYALGLSIGSDFAVASTLSFKGVSRDDYTLRFATENKGIVSVTDDGRITALKNGVETLTVTATWNGNAYPSTVKTISVRVVDGFLALSNYRAKLVYNPFAENGGDGKTFDLSTLSAKATVGGQTHDTGVTLSYTVAEGADLVDVNGSTVTAKGNAEGTALVKVGGTYGDVSLQTVYFRLTVSITRGSVSVQNPDIRFATGSLKTVAGGEYENVTTASLGDATVCGPDGNVAAVAVQRYTVSDTAVAAVDSQGTVTVQAGVRTGKCEIYATVGNQDYYVGTVTVTDYTGYKAIANLSDINAVASDVAGKYVLVNDVDLNGRTGAIATDFTGVFDGNGHKLSNAKLAHPNNNNSYSLFAGTTNGAVKNIAFINLQIVSDGSVADNWSQMGIVGSIGASGVVENIYAETTVAVKAVKGKQSKGVLVGNADKGTIRNCIVNVRYENLDAANNGFGTMFGATWGKKWGDCYAVVSGTAANSVYGSASSPDDYTNYSSLAALQEAKSNLFAEGGVFTGAFWQSVLREH